MRYRWAITTGQTWDAGTDANVGLGLSGDKNTMKEMDLNDPDTYDDWTKGDTNHGVFETADLGNLLTGTLKTDGSGALPAWTVDNVQITNDEDGRVWFAGVNSEIKGNTPFRLSFALTEHTQYDEQQKAKKKAADAAKNAEADEASSAEDAATEREIAAEEKTMRLELERQKRELKLALAKAKQQAELEKLRAQIAATTPGAQTQSPPYSQSPLPYQQTGAMRTIEIFGVIAGRLAPMTSAISNNGGRWSVVAGASVFATEVAGEGFGLGGTPGRWGSLYAGRSPTEFGLDADKAVMASDGSRGWALPSTLLTQIFGANWRQAIY